MFLQSSQSSSAPLSLDLEPDEGWKHALKVNIEAGLSSMVDEAKQQLNRELAKGIVGPEERERLSANHLATMKAIRQLAEEEFHLALQRERQERRWAAGAPLDGAWSESMVKEQQALMDQIQRERKGKAPASAPLFPPADWAEVPPPASSPPAPLAPVQLYPSAKRGERSTWIPPTSSRRAEHVTRTPTPSQSPDNGRSYFFRPVNSERDEPAKSLERTPTIPAKPRTRSGSMSFWNPPNTGISLPGRSIPSPVYDPESIRRAARTPNPLSDPRRLEGVRRNSNTSTRPTTHEFWRPSIPAETDSRTSRTLTLARGNNTTSTASPSTASVQSVSFTDPLRPHSPALTPGRRSSTPSSTPSFKAPSALSAALMDPIDAVVENSSGSQGIGRSIPGVRPANQEWSSHWERDRGDRPGYVPAEDLSGFTAHTPGSAYPRAGESLRAHVRTPSANQSAMKNAFSSQSGLSSSPSRNLNLLSRSPLAPDGITGSWQSSQLRDLLSSSR